MLVAKRVTVQVKGVGDGLVVLLGEGEWQEVQRALFAHIEERQSFFSGAKVALDVGNRILYAGDMGTLRDRLADRGVSLWAVIGNSPTTESTAQMLGLATRLSTPKSERAASRNLDSFLEGESAILLQRTLRSGFKVSFSGHVVVVGDVNPGAEIVASGSVVVWGCLRGVVHAGAEGNEQAVVCALDLTPTQLRIAGNISVAPKRKGKIQPEMVRVHEGQVVAEPWHPKEGGR